MMKIEIIIIVRDEKGNIIPSTIENVIIKNVIVNGVVVETLEATV